jgi:hypothetical protein
VQRIERAIAVMPIRADLLDKAFAQFRATGELPEQQRLAAAVVDRTLSQPSPQPESFNLDEWLEKVHEVTAALRRTPPEEDFWGRPIRTHLFREAVHGHEVVRAAARAVIRIAVRSGADVTNSGFLAGNSLPEHSGVALHLLGFPECLARPPYVAQARRLIARYADLRSRINYQDPAWFGPLGSAIAAFRETGQLPDDDLQLACVLADAELLALVAHQIGRGDAELLAAFDAAARAKLGSRAEAAAKVQELVRAGRLRVNAE